MPKANAKSAKCPDCGEAMVAGYITPSWMHMTLLPFIWVAGRPPVAAKFGTGPARKTTWLVVTSWRCKGCGRLDSYAN